MSAKKSGDTWVAILVAVIGVAGALGGAYITAGKRFDQSFSEIKDELSSIQARSNELEKATNDRIADLGSMQKHSDELKKTTKEGVDQFEKLRQEIRSQMASSNQVQVGQFLLTPSPNWSLSRQDGFEDGTNKDIREVTERIEFPQKYPSKPKIVVATINTLDAHPGGSGDNYCVRLSVFVKSWDSEGATFAIRTWDKSLVYNVGVTWIAVQ